MNLGLIGKDLVLEGSRLKMEDKQVRWKFQSPPPIAKVMSDDLRAMRRVLRRSNEHCSRIPVGWFYSGDYTTRLYRDCMKLLYP